MFPLKKILIEFKLYYLCFIALAITLPACHTSRKLKENQYLLQSTKITGFKSTKIPSEEFEAFQKQKPNRKFFQTFPFFVAWYNMFDDSVIAKKREQRNDKYDIKNANRIKKSNEKNAKRIAKGKEPKEPKLLNKEDPILLENLRDIGEAPVVFDSLLTEQTADQMNKFLFSKGYFNNKVIWIVDYAKSSDSLVKGKQLAHVTYSIVPNSAYFLNSVTYTIEDTKIAPLFYADTINSLLKICHKYSAFDLEEERNRITKLMLNNGYYFFESAFVSFKVDSNYANNFVSVEVVLKKFTRNYSSNNDSIINVNHTKYYINSIKVITEQVAGNVKDLVFTDTSYAKGYDIQFLHNSKLKFSTSLLADFIKLQTNTVFMRDTAETTFKNLMSLGVFKGVTIQFIVSDDSRSRLDCYIICSPLIKQSLTAETEGIHTLGSLGVDGSIIYRNKNLFKGGEVLQFKIQGALTAQNQIGDEKDIEFNSFSNIQKTFNTFQFGPELSFSVPRAFFPFSLIPFKNEMAPRTFYKTSVNYQARSNFIRNIISFENGFNFSSRSRLYKFEIVPFEIYSVKAKLSDAFKNDLANLNDAFLLNSFIDHITTLSKVGVVYKSKENISKHHGAAHYVRCNLMSSGNILRALYKLRDAKTDSAGRYTIFNVPFAHFLKAELEYRLYIPITKKSKLVYRVAGGIGKTLKNLNVLPYEQSFFSGGPNSIRAWRARTLGPGGYDPTTSSTRFDKIGDILLEGNVEYRFHIIKSFYGALFADAGNIWRLEKAADKPNGEFRANDFYNQIAVGGGVGIRWDLDFLILRFDFAAPIKDPKYEEGNRFTYDKKPWKSIIINFGIGYPF